jgi:pyrrolidone-carboxylate peptidase
MNRASSALLFTGLLSLSLSVNAQVELDVEELRLDNAAITLPDVVSRYQGLVDSLTSLYSQNNDELGVTQLAAKQGERLWQQAVRDVQSGSIDDRPLYWSRLAMLKELKTTKPAFNIAQWQQEILINAVEKSSRGFSNIQFDDDVQIKILLSGFDPFFLDRNIGQSNPSGLVALALDGFTFTVAGKKAQIETIMIPVRFADFDQGLIESLLTPIYRDNSVDMIFTVSMGRDDFDLERFPGRHRSAAAPDNLNVLTGANKQAPLAPLFEEKNLNGPEFVEFSLPVKAMQSVKGQWKINDNHGVITLAKGAFDASSLVELQGSTSVEGSGGGYLSNEISYRAVLLGQQLNSHIPVGHIHTPRVAGYDADTEAQILEQVKAMVIAAAASL